MLNALIANTRKDAGLTWNPGEFYWLPAIAPLIPHSIARSAAWSGQPCAGPNNRTLLIYVYK